jgi:hypothetical protein
MEDIPSGVIPDGTAVVGKTVNSAVIDGFTLEAKPEAA